MKTLCLVIITILVASVLVEIGNVFADDVDSNKWHKLYLLGKFTHAYPPKPDQIFVAQYRITNATLQSISSTGDVSVIANTVDKGLFELKFPRNFPYHNQDPSKMDFFININGYGSWSYYHPDGPMTEDARKQLVNTVARPPPYPDSYSGIDDCYYLFSVPFYTYAKIDIVYGFNGLILAPYHGDDILQSCNDFTIAKLPPLKQIEFGMAPKDVTCNVGFDVLMHPDNKTISCVKSYAVTKLMERGKWTRPPLDPHMNPKTVLTNSSYDGISTDGKSIVTINNQTYYQTTLGYSIDDLKYGTVEKFQNVTFVFPQGLARTTEGGKTTLDVKFQDNGEEIYDGIPTRYGPYANNAITLLSNHVAPQAGITYYGDKIKLLVSTGKQKITNEDKMLYANGKTEKANPLGVLALVIYHPPDLCLSLIAPSNMTVHGCPPNTFYLKINSVITAYLMGYNICDGDSCTKTNDLSVLLPIKNPLRPNFQMIGLPEDLHWKYGDTVKIQLYVSSANDISTVSLLDLGNSTIVP
ncbi:MAG: hypothetical protein LV477_01705 [Candidatus Nitrosotalea sp.]|nr:hypothetical protein [Candidatus Nitrosotalea sp.]